MLKRKTRWTFGIYTFSSTRFESSKRWWTIAAGTNQHSSLGKKFLLRIRGNIIIYKRRCPEGGLKTGSSHAILRGVYGLADAFNTPWIIVQSCGVTEGERKKGFMVNVSVPLIFYSGPGWNCNFWVDQAESQTDSFRNIRDEYSRISIQSAKFKSIKKKYTLPDIFIYISLVSILEKERNFFW